MKSETTLDELAKEKVNLQMTLEAISMCNVYGKSSDDLVSLEKRKIETSRKLFQVESKIKDYIEGKTP